MRYYVKASLRIDMGHTLQRRKSSVQKINGPVAIERNGGKSTSAARSLEREWLKQHQSEHIGAWVALEGASLVAHGSSARQVLDAANSAGYEQPLVVHIPSEPELPFGGW
jgi:hypothetical protein